MMPHAVSRLDLFVTEACNMACGYCFARARSRGAAPLGQMLEALDWLMESRSAKVHVSLWGGEPLLARDPLERVVAHAHEAARRAGKTITLSMPTNATLLDEETIRWLGASGIRIFLSIDGDERAQRGRPLADGRASTPLVERGMEAAFGRPGPRRPEVRMTLTPQNAHRLAENARYLAEHGACGLLVYAAYDRTWSTSALAALARGQRALASTLIDAISGCDDPSLVPTVKPWRHVLHRLHEGAPRRSRTGPVRDCGAGTRLMALEVDGSLSPCHRFAFYGRTRGEPVSLGSLARGPSPGAMEAFSKRRVEDLEGETRCVACDLFELCTYGCMAINHATTGHLDRIPRAACAIVRTQAEACREIHEALEDDPRYGLWLGLPLAERVGKASREIGERAYRLLGSVHT
jgi:uncharacterized protein